MAKKNFDNGEMSWKKLFDEKSKVAAFDLLAENFYERNFGSMQKSDIDLFMFSIFIERILIKEGLEYNDFSDYKMSKALGITQQRINNLKVKKELKYPNKDFDWKVSFAKLSKNARYDDKKIKIYIPDPNVYIELKNVIESKGGYVEITLNPKLLQLPPEYYLWLVREVCSEEDKMELDKAIKKQMESRQFKAKDFGPTTMRKFIKDNGVEMLATVIESVVPAVVTPISGASATATAIIAATSVVGTLLRSFANAIKNR